MSDNELAFMAADLDAIILDRMRLLSAGNPEPYLDERFRPKIQNWCEKRLEELRA